MVIKTLLSLIKDNLISLTYTTQIHVYVHISVHSCRTFGSHIIKNELRSVCRQLVFNLIFNYLYGEDDLGCVM